MSEKVKGFLVTLDGDYHDEQADMILSAIKMIKAVLTVEPVPVEDYNDYMIRNQVKREIREKLFEVLD